MVDEITPEQWRAWLDNPCTQSVLRDLEDVASMVDEAGERSRVLGRTIRSRIAAAVKRPTGTEDTDKVGADGRRVTVKG
jgi:hypothetical protein